MHEYHTELCPVRRDWADTCNCADRLTFYQLTSKCAEQALTIYSATEKSAARFLYTVGDDRIIARVKLAKEYDAAEKENGNEK